MKTSIKIAIIILCIGWIPILILPQLDFIPKKYNILIGGCGVFILMFGMLIVNTFMMDSRWWKTQEELDEIKNNYEESYLGTERYLEAVKRKCANAQGFTAEEVGKTVKKLEENNWRPNK